MSAPLGWEPQRRPLFLSIGADFIHTITPRTGLFPAGMTAWIQLWNSTATTVLDTWNATCTTTTVSWAVPLATADAIPTGARYRLYVSYPTAPTSEYEWAYGPVVRKQ